MPSDALSCLELGLWLLPCWTMYLRLDFPHIVQNSILQQSECRSRYENPAILYEYNFKIFKNVKQLLFFSVFLGDTGF